MSRNIIDDGYTRRGCVREWKVDKRPAAEAQHGSLEFSYRPMLPDEVWALEGDLQKLPKAEAARIVSHAVADHLVEWSERDAQGRPVPITADNFGRLPFNLWDCVYRIVAGTRLTDEIPGATVEETSEYLTARRSQVTNPGQAQLAADQKN